jgi:hypothetical protein
VLDQILQHLDLTALATKAIEHIPAVIAGVIIFIALWGCFALRAIPPSGLLSGPVLLPP